MIKNNIVIIISRLDIAGMNMLEKLKLNYTFKTKEINFIGINGEYEYYHTNNVSILVVPERQLDTDYLRKHIIADMLIFASKHTSKAGQKAILVHSTGVWNGNTDFGGNEFELSMVEPNVMKYAYDKIKAIVAKDDVDYWVGIECTHHGPTSFEIPLLFFEVGGTIEEWNDEVAISIITKVIVETIDAYLNKEIPQKEAFIGIGGNHYCAGFLRIMENEDKAPGHIIPKHLLSNLNKNMLIQAYDKTKNDNKHFLIDKKGTNSSQRQEITDFLNKNNLEWKYI